MVKTSFADIVCSLCITETQVSTIESAFHDFTERKDIAILLINQHVEYPLLLT